MEIFVHPLGDTLGKFVASPVVEKMADTLVVQARYEFARMQTSK